jgi:hypothetical protein
MQENTKDADRKTQAKTQAKKMQAKMPKRSAIEHRASGRSTLNP